MTSFERGRCFLIECFVAFMRILLIEDDAQISTFVEQGLSRAGHKVVKAADGKIGLELALKPNYDAMIIDRMLPSIDGLSIIKAVRASGNNTPVLILSSLGEVDDRVKGLRSGGDDYLVKPFAFEELLARIEILGRKKPAEPLQTITIDDLEVDVVAHKVKRSGKKIDLQTREYKLLDYLLKNRGQVVTRTMLLENVWDYNFDPQTNVIDVHVSRLRNKIDKGFEKQLIKTVRGAGYIIE
jgi:two-component system OmpR family response regulator